MGVPQSPQTDLLPSGAPRGRPTSANGASCGAQTRQRRPAPTPGCAPARSARRPGRGFPCGQLLTGGLGRNLVPGQSRSPGLPLLG